MQLLHLTPEGKIILTLAHGKHTYSELKQETGLSDRWLTAKLSQLTGKEGVVEKSSKWYGLTQDTEISEYELSLYAAGQARLVAGSLSRLPFVKAVVLFGSVAQKRISQYGDLDLIVVVAEPQDKARAEVLSEVSLLESKYHFTIEPLILSEKDFLENIRSNEGGIVFGVAEGFEVLVDKTCALGRALEDRVEEIKRTHEYLTEERVWLRAK